MKKFIAVLMIPLFLSSGCFLAKPASQPYIVDAVTIAVDIAESQGISANTINSIAKSALAIDSGSLTSLATVSVLIDAEIAKLGLPIEVEGAALVLEIALAAAIKAKINGSSAVGQLQIGIADVLNAVIAATGGMALPTQVYAPHAPTLTFDPR